MTSSAEKEKKVQAQADDVFRLESTPLAPERLGEDGRVRRGLLIEASAGTGKTFSIENIVLKVLVDPAIACPPERLLVVTFTRSATAELRGRLKARLEAGIEDIAAAKADLGRLDDKVEKALEERLPFLAEALRSRGADASAEGVLERAAALARQALASFDRASIETIDAFCGDALSSFALSAQAASAGEVEPDDSALAAEALDEAVRSRLGRLEAIQHPGIRAAAIRRYADSKALRACLASLPASFLAAPPDHDPMALDALDKLEAFDLAEASDALGAAAPGEDREAALARALDEDVFATLLDAQRRAEALKAERGAWTFNDVKRRLAAASRQPGFVAALRGRFSCVLVDEFQDTDREQFEIFENLFLKPAEGAAGGGAEGEAKPPAAIFVGDPKQAIYSFRGADVDAYLEARREAAQRCRLPKNWRTAPALIRAFNILFSPAQALPEAARAVLYAYEPVEPMTDAETTAFPIASAAPEGLPAEPVLEILSSSGTGGDGKDLSVVDAEAAAAAAVARDVKRLLARGRKRTGRGGKSLQELRPKDFAVLIRKRRQIEPVKKALRALGLRCSPLRGRSVYETEEAEAVAAALSAALSPKSFAKLAAAASTRLIGLAFASILPLEGSAEPKEGAEAAEASAAADAAEAARFGELLRVREALERFLERCGAEGFAPALAGLLEAFDACARLLALDDGAERLAALSLLSQKLDEAGRRLPSPAALLSFLEVKIREARQAAASDAAVPEEDLAAAPADAGRVVVMTMHAAKGLEFPVVYIPFAMIDGRQSANPPRSAVWAAEQALEAEREAAGADGAAQSAAGAEDAEEAPALTAAACFAGAAYASGPAGERARAEAQQAALEEEMRLLYVAMTRAKSRLVVVMHKKPGGNAASPALCLLSGERSPGALAAAEAKAGCEPAEGNAGHEGAEGNDFGQSLEALAGKTLQGLREKAAALAALAGQASKASPRAFSPGLFVLGGLEARSDEWARKAEAAAAAPAVEAAADEAVALSAAPGLRQPAARTRFRSSFTAITRLVGEDAAKKAKNAEKSSEADGEQEKSEQENRECDEPEEVFPDVRESSDDGAPLETADQRWAQAKLDALAEERERVPSSAALGDALHRTLERLDFVTGRPIGCGAEESNEAEEADDPLGRLIEESLREAGIPPSAALDAARMAWAKARIRSLLQTTFP